MVLSDPRWYHGILSGPCYPSQCTIVWLACTILGTKEEANGDLRKFTRNYGLWFGALTLEQTLLIGY